MPPETYIKITVPAGATYLKASRHIELEELGRLALRIESPGSDAQPTVDSIVKALKIGMNGVIDETSFSKVEKEFKKRNTDRCIVKIDMSPEEQENWWVSAQWRAPANPRKQVTMEGSMHVLAECYKESIHDGVYDEAGFLYSLYRQWGQKVLMF